MIRSSAAMLCSVAALMCPAVASAAPSWLAPVTPFDQSPAQEVVTAMAPDGTAVVGRVRTAGEIDAIDAIVRRPGGQTSPPAEIARTDANRRVLLARGCPFRTAGSSWPMPRSARKGMPTTRPGS